MSNLGIDFIFEEILPKLPVKSLMCFKCVSKSFKTVISSRDFTKLYLRHRCLSSSSSSSDFLIYPIHTGMISYDLDSSTAIASFDWPKDFGGRIVGSANGFLCILIWNMNKGIMLFCVLNPTTRMYKYVPVPVDVEPRRCAGFAFDPYNLDFKIVVISYHRIGDYGKSILTRITNVYSLNTNSWMVVETNMPEDDMINVGYDNGVLVNDYLLHWKFMTVSFPRRPIIGCFDVCKNQWVDHVKLPHYYNDPTNKMFLQDFGVLDGCLFLLLQNCAESCFHVWVMKEYGVQDSWFKLSIPKSTDTQHGVMPIVSREGSDQVLIRRPYQGGLSWYDRKNGELSEAKFDGPPRFVLPAVCMCSTSLVELPGSEPFGDPPQEKPDELV